MRPRAGMTILPTLTTGHALTAGTTIRLATGMSSSERRPPSQRLSWRNREPAPVGSVLDAGVSVAGSGRGLWAVTYLGEGAVRRPFGRRGQPMSATTSHVVVCMT